MPTITRVVVLCLALLIVGAGTEARAEKKVKAIASFSILGDMTKNVGGARVEVTTLVGPNGDAHVYEPTPADAKAVSSADLVIVNGLGMEGWMERLIKTSGYKGPVVVTTKGIKPRGMTAEEKEEHGHGHSAKHEHKIDPHAWQNLANGQVYVDNIAAGLSAVDPGGASIYKANAEAYMAKLSELDKWVKTEFSSIPKAQRRMITSHDAFGYLGAAYGVTILSPMGVSTESEPSAGGVARLIMQIRKAKITAVFIENVSDPRLVEQISKESGVKLGGELYSDALSKPEGPAPTYIDMFKNNVTNMVAAMRKNL
jgi:zinc/manganese transport system substrate-binding protein